jgi:hypothetical protein
MIRGRPTEFCSAHLEKVADQRSPLTRDGSPVLKVEELGEHARHPRVIHVDSDENWHAKAFPSELLENNANNVTRD